MKPAWFPNWAGETCVIVASGPSAATVPLEAAKGKARFFAINTSWRLCPWADVLYACDFAWWDHAEGCPQFRGLKLTASPRAAEKYPDVRLVNTRKSDDRLFLTPRGTIGWGSNSGFQGFNCVVQFGCRTIILVGFDMTVDGGLHWHGPHPAGLKNPNGRNIHRWRRAMDNAAPVVRLLGIKVINCSPVSKLTAYPKMTLEQALEHR